MAEKREGFGIPAEQQAKLDPVVYQTPDYRVIIGKLSGPAETPEELRVRYIIQHKKHGVVYGHTAGIGQAVAHALVAQAELQNGNRIAEEQKARNYEATTGNDGDTSPTPKVPRFQ